MMDLIALGIAGILLIVVLLLIGPIVLWLGTKFAGIENASFKKAIISVVVLIVLSAVLGVILGPLAFLDLIISFVVTLWVVKALYKTSWTKAFLALILTAIVFLTVSVIILALLGFGLSSLGIF